MHAGFPKGERSPQADRNVTRTQQGNVAEPTLDQMYKQPNEGPGGSSKPVRAQSSSGLVGDKRINGDNPIFRPTSEVPPPGTGAAANTGRWPASGGERLRFPEGGPETRGG